MGPIFAQLIRVIGIYIFAKTTTTNTQSRVSRKN